MKVAITARGPNLACQVDARFGRAEHILVVDTNTGLCEPHRNSDAAQAVSGAGMQAGKSVVDLGARALITGSLGPKAFQVLQTHGVEVYSAGENTAQDALRAFDAGKLAPITQPNHQGRS
jgi:predicted Fe-Mo cluster-binding NifX family protein